MSQNSIVIPESPLSGAGSMTAINNALDSLATDFSGPDEPKVTWALMRWADTKNSILRLRNLTNTGWIPLMDLKTGNILTNAATATLADSATNATKWSGLVAHVYDNISLAVSALSSSTVTFPSDTWLPSLYFMSSTDQGFIPQVPACSVPSGKTCFWVNGATMTIYNNSNRFDNFHYCRLVFEVA